MESYLPVILLLGVLQLGFSNGACPTIVSPSDWGARPPTSTSSMRTPVDFVIIHHTTTGTCSSRDSCSRILRNIQYDHMNNRVPKFSDVGYSFLVGGDGVVYQGRGWDRQGAHAPRYNARSIGISLIGDFQSARPTEAQLTATKQLIECGVSRGKVKSDYKLLGHRQTKATNCPGNVLYDIIKGWSHWTNSP